MTTKPETLFANRIHRKLNKDVYKQAMGLTATNGTPDYYYEGNISHLWVEYKWYPKEPNRIDLCDTDKKPCLSRLQQDWLARADNNEQPLAVVAGYPGGCIVLAQDEFKMILAGVALDSCKMSEQAWVDNLNELNV